MERKFDEWDILVGYFQRKLLINKKKNKFYLYKYKNKQNLLIKNKRLQIIETICFIFKKKSQIDNVFYVEFINIDNKIISYYYLYNSELYNNGFYNILHKTIKELFSLKYIELNISYNSEIKEEYENIFFFSKIDNKYVLYLKEKIDLSFISKSDYETYFNMYPRKNLIFSEIYVNENNELKVKFL